MPAPAEHVLRLLEAHAFYADRVDWTAAATGVAEALARGLSLDEALKPVFAALGDRHSSLRQAEGGTHTAASALPDGHQGRTGYLRLPGFTGDHRSSAAKRYVKAAWALLRPPCPRGWVLDLRGNRGGNLFPMLAAAGPLLGADARLAYLKRGGNRLTYRYARGTVYADDRRLLSVRRPPSDLPDAPLAVLTDARTASSAEGVLVACLGRAAGVRVFGAPTAGVPTGNVSHLLPDGSTLAITTSLATDRLGRSYDGPLPPDDPGGTEATAAAWLEANLT
ncbi:S41 family peptidase [Amycolatopsis minnesotensis]|uniref:Tail specific protease domain-containing protein n=1 Tax=Amycolatopsis minnesotensis TaxID=337894 RepID=A0ABN2QTV0_9PSEU